MADRLTKGAELMRLIVPITAFSLMSLTVSAATAAPADAVRTRIAGYRALGAAFKSLNDTLRQGDGRSPAIGKSVQQIMLASREQYKWFPKGSGPQPGLKTAARSEIWTRGAEFRAAQDGLSRQASALQRAVAAGGDSAIRSEARKLGAACKTCHDQFRTSDD